MDILDVKDEGSDKYSLRGRVFNHIRSDILSGKYHENDSLKEVNIANELGVSRTPVREAIKQLELEGLVTSVPNKGAIVHGISAKDMHDIYAVRSLIEGLATKWATTNITDQQIEELEEIVFLSEFHLSKGNYEQLFKLDTKYHEIIYNVSKSRIIKHVLSDFHHYAQRLRRMSLSNPERAKASIEEHKKIIAAIKERDLEMVEQYANEHIMKIVENAKIENIM